MTLIAGLGNPGGEYAGTRHNAGFDAISLLAERLGVNFGKKFTRRAFVAEGAVVNGEKAVLIAPQTFMNLSGDSVAENLAFYKLTPENLIVIYDDTALDLGEIRVRKQGTAGGHNGLKNIILRINTDVFTRIRIGVGAKPPQWDLKDYVLSKFTKAERPLYEQGAFKAAEAAELILKEGADKAMNTFNKRKANESEEPSDGE